MPVVDVPYLFHATYVRARHRVPERHRVVDFVPARIPDFSEGDAPPVLAWGGERRHLVRAHAGALWMPAKVVGQGPHQGQPIAEAAIGAAAREWAENAVRGWIGRGHGGPRSGGPFVPADQTGDAMLEWSIGRPGFVPMDGLDVRDWLASDRVERRAEAARDAALGSAVIGGILHVRTVGPMLSVLPSANGTAYVAPYDRAEATRPESRMAAFRPDRASVAVAMAEFERDAIVDRSGEIEMMDPDLYATAALDEVAVRLTGAAERLVLGIPNDEVTSLSPVAIRAWADIKELLSTRRLSAFGVAGQDAIRAEEALRLIDMDYPRLKPGTETGMATFPADRLWQCLAFERGGALRGDAEPPPGPGR